MFASPFPVREDRDGCTFVVKFQALKEHVAAAANVA